MNQLVATSTAQSRDISKTCRDLLPRLSPFPVLKNVDGKTSSVDAKDAEKAIVRFSYLCQNDDQLNLNTGDIITILDKEMEDHGWWIGKDGGHIGAVPYTCVKLVQEVGNTPTTTTTNMTPFKYSKCCATYTSQKSLRQYCRDKHGDRITCPYEGCTYTCAKSRQQHLTSHIDNVHLVLGRGYETYSPVSIWRMDRPGKAEAIRRMRQEEQPKQRTVLDETGSHEGRRSQEEEKMDHSDSDSERLSVLADRIDFDYGMFSPESIELAEPLFSSPRRVARKPSEEATTPHHAGDNNNPITNVPKEAATYTNLDSSESSPLYTATASHQGEDNPLIAQSVPRAAKDEALSFLTLGGMPLYPPAMRNWSGVDEESILLGRMLRWPPRKWSTMTADAKLMIWEMAALSLEKELDPHGQPHRNTLLEKYNFLALPGTAQPKIVDGQSVHFMRFHNFCALRDIITSAEDPNGLLESFRKAAEVRDQSTDNVIRRLQGIPVWI